VADYEVRLAHDPSTTVLMKSGAVPNSLPLASGHGDERFKAPHVVCGWLRKRLSEADRTSFRFSLRSIGGTMKAVVVELLVLAVDRVRPVHNRRLHRGLLFLNLGSRRM